MRRPSGVSRTKRSTTRPKPATSAPTHVMKRKKTKAPRDRVWLYCILRSGYLDAYSKLSREQMETNRSKQLLIFTDLEKNDDKIGMVECMWSNFLRIYLAEALSPSHEDVANTFGRTQRSLANTE